MFSFKRSHAFQSSKVQTHVTIKGNGYPNNKNVRRGAINRHTVNQRLHISDRLRLCTNLVLFNIFKEWSYIPVGGSLPNTEQKNLAFGAAASMVHPATGYSVVRSLSEAPNYAAVIAKILRQDQSKEMISLGKYTNISKQGIVAI